MDQELQQQLAAIGGAVIEIDRKLIALSVHVYILREAEVIRSKMYLDNFTMTEQDKWVLDMAQGAHSGLFTATMKSLSVQNHTGILVPPFEWVSAQDR